jgi:hypothetical protein
MQQGGESKWHICIPVRTYVLLARAEENLNALLQTRGISFFGAPSQKIANRQSPQVLTMAAVKGASSYSIASSP